MYYNSDRNAIYSYMLSEIRIDKLRMPLLSSRTNEVRELVLLNTFFISGIDGASNVGMLRGLGITTVFSILDAEDELPHYEDITYHRFNIPDGEGDIIPIAQQVAEMIDAMQGQRILIHCFVGMSRSVSILIYYLMLHSDLTYGKARKMIQRSRRIAAPVEQYRNQILAWDGSRSKK